MICTIIVITPARIGHFSGQTRTKFATIAEDIFKKRKTLLHNPQSEPARESVHSRIYILRIHLDGFTKYSSQNQLIGSQCPVIFEPWPLKRLN